MWDLIWHCTYIHHFVVQCSLNLLYQGMSAFLDSPRRLCMLLWLGIEIMEWKCRKGVLENPWAGTTNDEECMFSIMRDLTGKHFMLREVRYTWRKVCIEFSKCLDQELGFYYFMSSHDHFIKGERPDLSQVSRQAVDQDEESDLQTSCMAWLHFHNLVPSHL